MAENAYIVSATRTPGGKKNGSLSGWHPADMGAMVLDELIRKTGIDPKKTRIKAIVIGPKEFVAILMLKNAEAHIRAKKVKSI